MFSVFPYWLRSPLKSGPASALVTTVSWVLYEVHLAHSSQFCGLEEAEAIGGRLKEAVISRLAPALTVKETAVLPREEQSFSPPSGTFRSQCLCSLRTLGNQKSRSQPNYFGKYTHLTSAKPVVLSQSSKTWTPSGPPAPYSFRSRHCCTG